MKLVKPVELDSYENLGTPLGNLRKVKTETKIRALFIGRGSRKFPKKEYIRCKLIRGHKRAFRSIIETQNTLNSICKNSETSSSKVYYWNVLYNSYLHYPKLFEGISPVEVGPINRQMKKRNMDLNNIKKSFNREFCQEYFQDLVVRESYYNYVNYLFGDIDCDSLIQHFGFKCCSSLGHNTSCTIKWTILKRYCLNTILEDISVEPYEPNASFAPIPSVF